MGASSHTIGQDFAGRIRVALAVRDGRVTGVEIDSTRPKGVAQVFAGRNPDDVVGLLGLVFSLCATAQSVAGLQAVEQARDLRVHDGEAAARDMLREAEMLTQTALRVFMDWPRILGLGQDVDIVRQALGAQGALEAKLFGGRNWKISGGVGVEPDVDGARAVLTGLRDALAGETVSARLMARLDDLDLNGFGAATLETPELGALTRHWDREVVRDVRQRHGAGLRARLAARLEDLHELPQSLLDSVERLVPCAAAVGTAAADGSGTATVETARGPLSHRVTLQDGVIASYVIDAPTDANFLSDGVVALGLMAADGTDGAALRRAAELHVLAIDPCVSCELEIHDA